MTGLILLTHGTLGRALYLTSCQILGDQENVEVVSSGELSPAEIFQRIESIVEGPENRSDGVFILVDLKGGNTWNVACKVAYNRPWVQVISGANLTMLLSFFTKRETQSPDQLAETLVQDAHRGIDRFQITT